MSEETKWWERQSETGAALLELQAYNQSPIMGEYIDPDRWRYFHRVKDTKGKMTKFTCGTKYNAKDTSKCAFCCAHQYGRSFDEALTLAEAIFVFPVKMDFAKTVAKWQLESATK